MANDKDLLGTIDDQLFSVEFQDSDEFRSCPTPSLENFLFDGSLNGAFDEELNNIYMSLNTGESNANSPANQTAMAMTPQLNSLASPNVLQSTTFDNMTQPSTSFINTNSSFNFIPCEANTFVPIQAGSSREDDNKTPLITDSPMLHNKNNSRKEKCMTRNAVLARQNREKKKSEHHNLLKRLEQLEEENASLKKRCNEFRENCDNLRERNTYLEAIIQNLPQIYNMVEHMNTLPSNKVVNANNKKT